MKKLALVSIAAVALAGCSLFNPSRPPSATEKQFFTITTNVIPITTTNSQARVIASTNAAGAVAIVTNFVEVPVVVLKTNYVLQPNANAESAAGTAGTITNYLAPGFGGLATAALLGLAKIYASLRSQQAVNANLTQIIETARSVILASPNGKQLAMGFDNWMMKHQNDAQLANEIARMVDATVNPSAADDTAEKLLREATAPLTPKTVV